MEKKILTDRLNDIIEAVMSVARGDYSTQIGLSGKNDDIDSLAIGINMMIDDLRERKENETRNLGKLSKLNKELRQEIRERKQSEKVLLESEEKFKTLAEQSPNMIFINKMDKVVYANKRSEEFMGYKREEYYAADFDFMALIAPDDRELLRLNYANHLKGEDVEPYEYALITKDGKRIEVIFTSKLIDFEGEKAILGIITDITERKRAEEQIRASLKEKEVLLKEIHHRVKNNLQVISSMLNMQSRYLKDKHAKKHVLESRDRVYSMAQVHENLYQSRDQAHVDIYKFIRNLMVNIFQSYDVNTNVIKLKLNVDRIFLEIDQAVP